jgi:hypothetical protein
VFRLIKLMFYLACFIGLGYVAFTVPLGERTLVEHLQVIFKTRESQELVDGTKAKVGDLVGRATEKVVEGVAKQAPSQTTTRGDGQDRKIVPQAPQETVEEQDRQALRKLIGQEKK